MKAFEKQVSAKISAERRRRISVNDHLVTTTRTAAGAPVPAHAKTDLSRVGNNARLNERRGAPAMKTYSAVRAPTSSRKPLARLSAGALNDTGRGKELKNPPPCDPVSNIPKGRVLLPAACC